MKNSLMPSRLLVSLSAIFLFAISSLTAQENEVLNTKSNPVFILMGISPTEIQSPSELGELTSSIQNATDNFMSSPSSYALDINPAKLFWNKESKFYNEEKIRTWTVSLGFNSNNVDVSTGNPFTNAGVGINYHFKAETKKKPKDTSSPEINLLNTQLKAQREYIGFERKRLSSDTIDDGRVSNLIQSFDGNISSLNAMIEETQKKIDNSITVKWIPDEFFLTASAGIVHDFLNNDFSNGEWSNYGAWIRWGFENQDKESTSISYLFIARFLHENNLPVEGMPSMSSNSIDVGTKLVLNANEGKFNFSLEAIYRNRPVDELASTSKYIGSINYKLTKDININFNFGKDFSGLRNQEGNIVSLINFISTFGTKD